jgi:hypothetical protein
VEDLIPEIHGRRGKSYPSDIPQDFHNCGK